MNFHKLTSLLDPVIDDNDAVLKQCVIEKLPEAF